jgi:tRNA-dihydrouridine synthase
LLKGCILASYLAGQGCGFDIDLVKMVSDAVTIPVIASSGAGAVEHFSEVFEKTNASAALAAGIFHRKEVLDPTLFPVGMLCYNLHVMLSLIRELSLALLLRFSSNLF